MGILVSTVGALSTFYPEAKKIFEPQSRRAQAYRLISKMPTLAAFAYRHSLGLPYSYPDNDLSYTGNFLNMLFKMTELKYQPHPVLERALDVLFILHADHEQNCSTNAMRGVGSSQSDPYSSVAAAAAALYGPLHGGANEAVLRMLMAIGSKDKVPEFIKKVKGGEGRLMGLAIGFTRITTRAPRSSRRSPTRSSRSRAATPCLISPSNSNVSLSRTAILSSVSSILTSTSIQV